MVKDSHDIVGSSVIMSPPRRLDDYEHHRTRPTPRSHPTALTRRTSARYLSRFEPLSFLVRQMVGRISTRPADHFCRPLSSTAPFATPNRSRNCSSGRLTAPPFRTGYHSPNPL